MKNVGLYAVIVQNSVQKLSWKQYGFTKFDEQINLLFIVLLYIMEQSLKEEKCTQSLFSDTPAAKTAFQPVTSGLGLSMLFSDTSNMKCLKLLHSVRTYWL